MTKSKYQDNFIPRAAQLLAGGANEEEVARQLGITENTLRNYRKRYEPFDAVFREAVCSDRHVEQALLKRATGFSCEEQQYEELVDKDGNILETRKRKTVVKEIPPDLRAIQFWLKNRQPERWKEKIAEPESEEEEYEFDDSDAKL